MDRTGLKPPGFCISGAILLALGACATVPDTAAFAPDTGVGTAEEIYVVSQQATPLETTDVARDRPAYPRAARLTVSIPPVHQLGAIEWHRTIPDPRQHFAVTDVVPLARPEMLIRQIARTEGDTVFLFVHGYNTTTSEALYRFAQIGHDFELPEPRLMFSWASAGIPPAYVYDRDSVLFARDDFVALLTDIARQTDKDINILAHSMGSILLMEALRQLALQGNRDVIARIDSVALMSPDIDPDIFRAQARVIGPLPQPFVIMASQADRALRISSVLTGGRERVGQIASADDVAGLGVTYIDFTDLADGTSMDHLTPVTSPEAINVLRRMIADEETRQSQFADFLVVEADALAAGR